MHPLGRQSTDLGVKKPLCGAREDPANNGKLANDRYARRREWTVFRLSIECEVSESVDGDRLRIISGCGRPWCFVLDLGFGAKGYM